MPRWLRDLALRGNLCQTVPRAMPEPIPYDGPQFIVHKKSGAVPIMAGCTRCTEKFFTPSSLLKDALGAGEYLRAKFDSHECQSHLKRRRWLP
jgi:hypothetical protein